MRQDTGRRRPNNATADENKASANKSWRPKLLTKTSPGLIELQSTYVTKK